MKPDLRIVSTLPSATETLFLLGLEQELLAVSHECNFPAAAATLPRATSANFNYGQASSLEIDNHVAKSLHNHESLYELDKTLLKELKPTHLITQQLCEVCAITPTQVQEALFNLEAKPEIISVAPKSLTDIITDVEFLGTALDRQAEASNLASKMRQTVDELTAKTTALTPKSVFCVEWIDPLYACGHWVPEMVQIAGGREVLGTDKSTARKLSWAQVAAADPDIIILIPCGFSAGKIRGELTSLEALPEWPNLKAARTNQIWIADGPAHFNQSGPRVILEGIPLLAQIIHPDVFGTPDPAQAVLARP